VSHCDAYAGPVSLELLVSGATWLWIAVQLYHTVCIQIRPSSAMQFALLYREPVPQSICLFVCLSVCAQLPFVVAKWLLLYRPEVVFIRCRFAISRCNMILCRRLLSMLSTKSNRTHSVNLLSVYDIVCSAVFDCVHWVLVFDAVCSSLFSRP